MGQFSKSLIIVSEMQYFNPSKISNFLAPFQNISPEEVFSEYTTWLRHLDPNLLQSEKTAIIRTVKSELGIQVIENNVSKLRPEKLLHIGKGSNLMDMLGIYLGKSTHYICPPVTMCIFCEKRLTKNNNPSQEGCHKIII